MNVFANKKPALFISKTPAECPGKIIVGTEGSSEVVLLNSRPETPS